MAKYIHKLNVMLDDELNSKVNEYAIRQGYSVDNKSQAIRALLRDYFNIKKQKSKSN